MNEREELLRKWAALAPGECEIDGGFVRYLPAGQGRFAESGFGFTSFLLSALIEAVRTQGWHYRLSSDETEVEDEQPCAWHSARVLPRHNVVHGYEASKSEPCDALLSAYIAALQALEASK